MADITMCPGKLKDGGDCPLAKDCWRTKAQPSLLQSWMSAPYKDNDCSSFVDMTGKRLLNHGGPK